MLNKALERVTARTHNSVQILQADIRTASLPENHFDIILAGAVLHHLRDDHDWESTFEKLYTLLKPGGCLFISDLVTQDNYHINQYIWKQYGNYLEGWLGGATYRQHVLDYIAKEDSPRSVTYQIGLMQQVGFHEVEILHKNLCFAAFGGVK